MRCGVLIFVAVSVGVSVGQAPPPPPPSYVMTEQEKAAVRTAVGELEVRIGKLRGKALLEDVEIYHKAGAWMLRYPEEVFRKEYVANALMVLERGAARAKALEGGSTPWTTRKGHVVRAYRSRVDRSLQPYAVVVPESYDGVRPMRLDVVLHGRDSVLSEVSFLARHEAPKTPDPYKDRLELHVFGRTNNAYRWAGETDVFEALAAVKQHYKVDTDRVVLRGFSMGGAGTWHIGLHYPTEWAGIEAGAGFNETIKYAKVTDPAPYERAAMRIYDAMDYARNVFQVPTVGYGGEIDPQLRASLNIQEQLRAEGLDFAKLPVLFLVGPKTPHRFHPDSKRESDAFLDAHVPRKPQDRIEFVTYTTQYSRCGWIVVEGLGKHYERAEVSAERTAERVKVRTKNVTRLKVEARAPELELDGQRLKGAEGVWVRRGERWERGGSEKGPRKRPGLQGPVDTALMGSVVGVSGSKGGWSNLSTLRMQQFMTEFPKWMRGDVPQVKDTELSEAQIRESNLILFGDPASNKVIARVLPKLPVKWTKANIEIAGGKYSSADHLLVMIYPNPLNPDRYVVLNSGHTFGEKEFKGTNALLYPRMGDWAVLNKAGEVVKAGLFDENWR